MFNLADGIPYSGPPSAHPPLPGMAGIQALPFRLGSSQGDSREIAPGAQEGMGRAQQRGRARSPSPPPAEVFPGLPVSRNPDLVSEYRLDPPPEGVSIPAIPRGIRVTAHSTGGQIRVPLRSVRLERNEATESRRVPGVQLLREAAIQAFEVPINAMRLLYGAGGVPFNHSEDTLVTLVGPTHQLALHTDRAVPNPEGFPSDEY